MVANIGAPLPATPDKRWYMIIVPTCIKPVDCVILGQTYFGAWTHWIATGPQSGFSVACSMNEYCTRCKEGMPPRWNGFLPVLLNGSREERVLQVSEGAARQLQTAVEFYGTLRGLHCSFGRRHKGKRNAPVDVTLVEQVDETRLPAAFPVVDSLHRMWGINEEIIRRGVGRPASPLPAAGLGVPGPKPPLDTFVPLPGPKPPGSQNYKDTRTMEEKRAALDAFRRSAGKFKGGDE